MYFLFSFHFSETMFVAVQRKSKYPTNISWTILYCLHSFTADCVKQELSKYVAKYERITRTAVMQETMLREFDRIPQGSLRTSERILGVHRSSIMHMIYCIMNCNTPNTCERVHPMCIADYPNALDSHAGICNSQNRGFWLHSFVSIVEFMRWILFYTGQCVDYAPDAHMGA